MEIKEMSVEELNLRKSAIATELDNEGADLDALELEVKSINEELEERKAEAARKAEIREEIADKDIGTEIKNFKTVKDNRTMEFGTTEYRNAYLANLQGKATVEERAAIAAAGALVPTETLDKIVTKVKDTCPLIDKVELLRVNGNVTFKVENSVADAAEHAENGEITGAGDTFTTVTLGAKEICKLITISETAATMSLGAFEDWITDMLARKIGEQIENELIAGDGTTSGKTCKGLASITFTDNTNAIDYGDAVTAGFLRSTIALLPGRASKNACWVMKRADFWTNIVALTDDETQVAIVNQANGKWYIYGIEVCFSDYAPSGVYYLGDFSKMVANLGEDIKVEASRESGFRYASIDYRGVAIFDCAPADAACFIKLHS